MYIEKEDSINRGQNSPADTTVFCLKITVVKFTVSRLSSLKLLTCLITLVLLSSFDCYKEWAYTN